MDTAIKNYIDSLDRRSIPWNRMFTAYGTAGPPTSGTSDLWGSLWTGVDKLPQRSEVHSEVEVVRSSQQAKLQN